MWKIRVRSTGVRMKPVYTNDRYLPFHVEEHYAAFLNAMLNTHKYDHNNFYIRQTRGVIKHSSLGYMQVKSDSKRKIPSTDKDIFEAFLPLFISEIISQVNASDFKDQIDRVKHNLFIMDHDTLRTCETITEAVIYMYHQWVENPNYFDQFYQ